MQFEVAATVQVRQIKVLREATARARSLAVDAESIIKAIPAGRFGDPGEFGDTCAFLCSKSAAYITGQNILIDGGYCMNTL